MRPDELQGLERLSDIEGQGDVERESSPASPPSTVADVSRVIEERRQPDRSRSVQSEHNEQGEDTAMHNSGLKEDTTPPPNRAQATTSAATATAASPTERAAVPKTDSPPRPSTGRSFDVRPPPLGHQLMDTANGRSPPRPIPSYPTYAQKEAMRVMGMDENDEGDRLQALAAQVYRSASQSVKPQESS